jgi:ubiquinone/menaquinone biosynthesis C-methylase UbiE
MEQQPKKNRGWSAEEYRALAAFDSEWRDLWWNQDFLELMAVRWRLSDVRSVLDVGCGAGHWGQMLATVLPKDARITGVDHESGFLEAASERARARCLPQHFAYRAASAEELPFEDSTFDLVTCQTVLIHVADARAALIEMQRVVKPDGIVVAAEPNNLVNTLGEGTTEPMPPFEETLRLLRFEELCHRGKIALGHGDTSVGEKLPGIFAELGFREIAVYSNDKCPALYPPYDTREQRLDLEQLFRWIDADVSGWGDKEAVRALYLAAGGDPAEFEPNWQLQLARGRAFKANVQAGRFHGARGHLQYLVSGRKPLQQART